MGAHYSNCFDACLKNDYADPKALVFFKHTQGRWERQIRDICVTQKSLQIYTKHPTDW